MTTKCCAVRLLNQEANVDFFRNMEEHLNMQNALYFVFILKG